MDSFRFWTASYSRWNSAGLAAWYVKMFSIVQLELISDAVVVSESDQLTSFVLDQIRQNLSATTSQFVDSEFHENVSDYMHQSLRDIP